MKSNEENLMNTNKNSRESKFRSGFSFNFRFNNRNRRLITPIAAVFSNEILRRRISEKLTETQEEKQKSSLFQ